MATNIGKYAKILLVFICVCIATEISGQTGVAVLNIARKDVGLIEGKSNTGKIQKYAQKWNETYPKGKLALNSPYCGLAVWYWYRMAGWDPNIKFAPRALNWKVFCKEPHPFFGMSIEQLEKIPEGAAIIYKNSWGNHVGVFHRAEMSWIYTYEGNTSSARSITYYARKTEGVFYLKTSINNKDLKPVYWCDCVSQSTRL